MANFQLDSNLINTHNTSEVPVKENLKEWQHSIVRNTVTDYRQALENYYIKDKQVIEMENGYKAFSLLSPAIGSGVARRRLKFIINDLKGTSSQESGAQVQIPAKNRTPHFVTMAITSDCQCDCLHCSASTYRDKAGVSKSNLGPDELKDSIRQMIDLGTTCVVFTGGEPFLFDGLYDLAKSVDKDKAICTVFTNGEYLDKEAVVKLKESGVFGVFVSFDFADPARHDANRRRKGIFDKACRGIELCQEQGILTGISTWATKEKISEGELDRLMELGKRLNVIELFLFDVIPTGRLDGHKECLLNENDFEQIRKLRVKYNTKPDFPRIIHQTMLTSIAFPCAGEGCPAGVAHMHLRVNGDISPCDFSPFSFGNIRTTALKDIWHTITHSELYSQPSQRCRLSDEAFWKKIEKGFQIAAV